MTGLEVKSLEWFFDTYFIGYYMDSPIEGLVYSEEAYEKLEKHIDERLDEWHKE